MQAPQAEHLSQNPLAAEIFESELAHEILQHAPTASLLKVNAAICQYLINNKPWLDENYVRDVLIRHHLCTQFTTLTPIDRFIELLSRPLSDKNNITECFILHHIFFNCNHLFQPELNAPSHEQFKIQQQRKALRNKFRPNVIKNDMFDRETRGRKRVESKRTSWDFGLCEASDLGEWAIDWHNHSFRPNKYRVAPNNDSQLVLTFRKAGIPFISGPSGTTADCLEGLHFLLPDFEDNDYIEYLNLLAAAEIAYGHHSLHEILLPAMNKHLFGELIHKDIKLNIIWDQIDYSRSYSCFLSPAFKEKPAFQSLATRYPGYLQKTDNKLQKAVILAQQLIRAKKSYAALEGGKWPNQHKVFGDTSLSHESFQDMSTQNIRLLEEELGTLEKTEQLFLSKFINQNFTLTHYTKKEHYLKMKASGKLLSFGIFNDRRHKFNEVFESNSIEDNKMLHNGDFVFFRFELKNVQNQSRFGNTRLIFEGKKSGLLEMGWVSLYDMLAPKKTSIVQQITYKGHAVRTLLDANLPNLTFQYENNIGTFNLASTVFYGPDIMKGIALAMIREIRRIGGNFQKEYLAPDLSLESLNTLLSQLFRVEAKLPSCVDLEYRPHAVVQEQILNFDGSVVDEIDIEDHNMHQDSTLVIYKDSIFEKDYKLDLCDALETLNPSKQLFDDENFNPYF